ncbi:hypothetical protein [Rugosimonospora acidiphila]
MDERGEVVRDIVEVLIWSCAGGYGCGSARDRPRKALVAAEYG